MESNRKKDLLTASRSACLMACPRRHYWRYERGFAPEKASDALRFGTAWHAAMEARWNGLPALDAYDAALSTATELDDFASATLAGMIEGYYAAYPEAEEGRGASVPEAEFRLPGPGTRAFDCAGKTDCLRFGDDGRVTLVEHKTTSEDISDGADYWLRLRFNPQLCQYVWAARQRGLPVDRVVYDVARKPAIKPLSAVPALDADGLKQVVDADGNRVFKRDGSPKQTADAAKGERVLSAPETPEQYRDRLAADIASRPGFYFQRREVSILDRDLESWEIGWHAAARMILHFRAMARRCETEQDGWPRSCGLNCRSCEFSGFCLQDIHFAEGEVPSGFASNQANSELAEAK